MGKRKARRAAAPEVKRGAPEWWPAAAVAALAFLVYANGIGNGFVGDDNYQLVKNPLVTGPIDLTQIFGSSVWAFLGLKANYYRPLPFLVYALIARFAGMHAPAFHFVMVALHALNTALVFWLGKRISGGRAAIAAAVLFALHPAHTEAVDWIAALPDLMVTALALEGVLLFAQQEGAPHGWRIFGHCGLYLLALWSKEPGAALPALYAGYGYFQLGRKWGEARQNLALYAAMAATFAVYLATRITALGGLAPAQQSFVHLSGLELALNIVAMAGRYLRMLSLPVGLNYFHVFHPAHGVTWSVLLGAAALAAVAIAFWRAPRPFVAYGILWGALALAPALNLTGLAQNVFAERYLYLPSVGFCWIAGWVWALLAAYRWKQAQAAAAAVILICAADVFLRNRDWLDTFTMLQVTVTQSPDAGLIHDALAGNYVERGQVEAALAEERLAVQDEPNMALLHKKLGYILLGKDPLAAAAELGKAASLEPDVASNHYDLAMALEAAGDRERAAAEYRRALALQPDLAQAKQALERLGISK